MLNLIRTAAAWLRSTLWRDGDMSEHALYLVGGLSFAALIARVGIGA